MTLYRKKTSRVFEKPGSLSNYKNTKTLILFLILIEDRATLWNIWKFPLC